MLRLEVQAVVIHDHGRLDLELLRDAGDRVAFLHGVERSPSRRDQERLADAEVRALLGDAVRECEVIELDLLRLRDRAEVVALRHLVLDDRAHVLRRDRDDAARSGHESARGGRHARAAFVRDARERGCDGRSLRRALRTETTRDGIRKRQHEERCRDIQNEAKAARAECRSGEGGDLVSEQLDGTEGEIAPQ